MTWALECVEAMLGVMVNTVGWCIVGDVWIWSDGIMMVLNGSWIEYGVIVEVLYGIFVVGREEY